MTATTYDPRSIPAAEKGSAIAGMAMTEKQGGSDVRANTTVARPLNGGGGGAEYELTGHKWFCSAPMSDLFLVLAQAESAGGEAEGLSCFLMPRILPDGSRNAFHIQRLKDKLGNHSNASSEIELHGAWARMVGEPGRGVPTIIEMVGHTRLDCVIGVGRGDARGGRERHPPRGPPRGVRQAADRPAADGNVLADLCLESEAAHRAGDAPGARLRRGGTPTRRPARTSERRAAVQAPGDRGRQVLGVQARAQPRVRGDGVPRRHGLRRGVGHAAAVPRGAAGLDLGGLGQRDQPRRAARARARAALAGGVPARGQARRRAPTRAWTPASPSWSPSSPTPRRSKSRARRVVEVMALCLQGSLLVRHAPSAVADAFCAARLAGDGGLEYGTLPAGSDFEAIIARSQPR